MSASCCFALQSGSFITDSGNQYDFFDEDESGNIVLQPTVPIFPEDFPEGQPEWPLSWWGVVEPSKELLDKQLGKEAEERDSKHNETEFLRPMPGYQGMGPPGRHPYYPPMRHQPYMYGPQGNAPPPMHYPPFNRPYGARGRGRGDFPPFGGRGYDGGYPGWGGRPRPNEHYPPPQNRPHRGGW